MEGFKDGGRGRKQETKTQECFVWYLRANGEMTTKVYI